MCTAETQSGFLNYSSAAATATASTKRRFTMKRTSSTAADALRGSERRQPMTTPRASGAACKNGHGMRRSQSVNVSSKSSAARRCPRSFMASMGSHSAQVEPVPARTQELPIPPRDRDGHHGMSLSRSADVHDLAKMYDHATWNMYERIVSARRRRISEMDSQELQQSQSRASVTQKAAPTKNQQPLFKTSSHDGESSTLATADETDRGSTTSSSWSRNDSPGTVPGMLMAANYAFSGLDRATAVHSCPPPAMEGDSEDDHFIFQLDM